MTKEKPIKVLIAKPGLDGHERGAKVVSLGLSDEGMEVIYLGLRQSPESIAETALQEDVDVVGLSCLTAAHNHLFPAVAQRLKEKGLQDVLLIGGGIIPQEDVPFLQEKGIKMVFGPGTPIKKIADYIKENVRRNN